MCWISKHLIIRDINSKYYENTIATKSVIYVMVITYHLLPIVDRKLKDQQQLYESTIYDLETLRYR